MNENFRNLNEKMDSSNYDISPDKIEAINECDDSNNTNETNSDSKMKKDVGTFMRNMENRRLLPNSANGTHILEGPENR